MSGWSPPIAPRKWILVALVFFTLWAAYGVVIVREPFFGLLPLLVFVPLYLVWRFLVALETIADAQQRIADQQERDGGHR